MKKKDKIFTAIMISTTIIYLIVVFGCFIYAVRCFALAVLTFFGLLAG